jgi:hypothetical protein
MIHLAPEYIKESGGLIPAMTRRSAEIVRKIIGNTQFVMPPNIQHLIRIITHKNPHLDEYLAILIFRAILPPEKRLIPLEEMALSSTDNDQVAKATWPQAAVFGMGGVHTGGAQALITYDEHTQSGQKKKNGSATMFMLRELFNSRPPVPLLRLCEEVDHIDAFGGAHYKHLGNYIKDLHDVNILLKKADIRQPVITESLSAQWKESIINACISALLIGIVEKSNYKNGDYSFTRKDYWEIFLRDSLEIFQAKTLLKNDPHFDESFNEVKKRIFSYNWRSDDAYLTERQPNGTRIKKDNKSIQQLSLMPFIAALCQEYWGAVLGQIILSHFWEVRIMRQMTLLRVRNALGNNLKDISQNYPFINSEIGSISLFLCDAIYTPEGELKIPLVIEINAHPNLVNVKAALDDFLNRSNQGFGYTLLHQQRTGTIVLTKGKNIPYEEWVKLCDLLIEIEGNSDEKPAGCWHKTENMEGKIESFLLNGNPAHQYAPKSSITGESLKMLIKRLHE